MHHATRVSPCNAGGASISVIAAIRGYTASMLRHVISWYLFDRLGTGRKAVICNGGWTLGMNDKA